MVEDNGSLAAHSAADLERKVDFFQISFFFFFVLTEKSDFDLKSIILAQPYLQQTDKHEVEEGGRAVTAAPHLQAGMAEALVTACHEVQALAEGSPCSSLDVEEHRSKCKHTCATHVGVHTFSSLENKLLICCRLTKKKKKGGGLGCHCHSVSIYTPNINQPTTLYSPHDLPLHFLVHIAPGCSITFLKVAKSPRDSINVSRKLTKQQLEDTQLHI